MTLEVTPAVANGMVLGASIIFGLAALGVIMNVSGYFRALARRTAAEAELIENETGTIEELQNQLDDKNVEIADLQNEFEDKLEEHAETLSRVLDLFSRVLHEIAANMEVVPEEPTTSTEAASQPGDAVEHVDETKVELHATEPVPTSEGTSGLNSQGA
jgi:TolA-binding protein